VLDIPDVKFNPIGSRGIGEIGITGTAAAVANAIYNATGKRVREYPITPDKIMKSWIAFVLDREVSARRNFLVGGGNSEFVVKLIIDTEVDRGPTLGPEHPDARASQQMADLETRPR
jgi:hypothetical protein